MPVMTSKDKPITFERVYDLPSKEHWFRLTEREQQKTPILKLNEGSFIEADRIIVRAGYYIQPMDMPHDLMKERAKKHVINYMNKYKDHEIFRKFGTHVGEYPMLWKKDIEGDFNEDFLRLAEDAFFTSEQALYKHVYYQLRKEWMNEERHKLRLREEGYLKTFYYVNIDSRMYQVHNIKLKQVGKYKSGSSYHPYECDPPYLAGYLAQSLYHVGYVRNQGKEEPVYVHPLDCEQDPEKYL